MRVISFLIRDKFTWFLPKLSVSPCLQKLELDMRRHRLLKMIFFLSKLTVRAGSGDSEALVVLL